MNSWEIWSWQAPGWPAAHLAVIVSHPDRAAGKDPVEVLLCSSQRSQRALRPHEVLLDQADGLDRPTVCKCDLIYAVPTAALSRKRGVIQPARRSALVRTMIAAHGWAQAL